MKLGVNALRTSDYKVRERILNICKIIRLITAHKTQQSYISREALVWQSVEI